MSELSKNHILPAAEPLVAMGGVAVPNAVALNAAPAPDSVPTAHEMHMAGFEPTTVAPHSSVTSTELQRYSKSVSVELPADKSNLYGADPNANSLNMSARRELRGFVKDVQADVQGGATILGGTSEGKASDEGSNLPGGGAGKPNVLNEILATTRSKTGEKEGEAAFKSYGIKLDITAGKGQEVVRPHLAAKLNKLAEKEGTTPGDIIARSTDPKQLNSAEKELTDKYKKDRGETIKVELEKEVPVPQAQPKVGVVDNGEPFSMPDDVEPVTHPDTPGMIPEEVAVMPTHLPKDGPYKGAKMAKGQFVKRTNHRIFQPGTHNEARRDRIPNSRGNSGGRR
jgi:hypothetical protein